jgi:predicted TIM-barrel fold metal-dependent hydrolase
MSLHHRRNLFRAGLVGLAEFVFSRPLQPAQIDETRRGIFDAHLHIPSGNGDNFQWWPITRDMPAFIAYLEKCGVRRGMLSSSWSNRAKTPDDYRNGNAEVAKYVDVYKGFRGACVITPQRIDEALREIERCRKQYGFAWLGECCNYMTGYKYDTPEWQQVMEQATRLGYVIHIHANNREMRYLIDHFPDSTIVFAHIGGSPEEIWERIGLVAAHKNCYLDIAGDGHQRVGILERAVKDIGGDRVVYGSDFTINEPLGVIARVNNAFLTEEDREKILFRNVDRLLNSRT